MILVTLSLRQHSLEDLDLVTALDATSATYLLIGLWEVTESF